jgi:hypothetical protein
MEMIDDDPIRGKHPFGRPSKQEMQCVLDELKAIRILLNNNFFGCEIHIAGMKVGVCANSLLIPIIHFQINEIKKAMKGKPNKWE